jgi:hypothetical protein
MAIIFDAVQSSADLAPSLTDVVQAIDLVQDTRLMTEVIVDGFQVCDLLSVSGGEISYSEAVLDLIRSRNPIEDRYIEFGTRYFDQSQSCLMKPLIIPVPNSMTEAVGIYQSDIIIRSAIISAIADLRANPALLDYTFASLPRDELTKHIYGAEEVARAKQWFLSTDIPVFLNVKADEVKLPCVSISLDESIEQENTLADLHYEPIEDNLETWPAMSCPFTPREYEPLIGKMTVPKLVAETLVIYPGMVLVTKNGRSFPILDIDDGRSFFIAKNVVEDFTDVVIKGKFPSQTASIESANFRESFTVGCHAAGEPVHLTYLHSIIVFCLLRYRETLLEARGFERSNIASSDMLRNEALGGVEQAFSRHIKVSGFVRQYWPKLFTQKVTGVTVQPLRITDAVKLPPDTDPDDASWIGDQDSLTFKLS